ncbi:MAG: DNA repair protein [Pasteurellales bacterium]|nr:MAG: DNA repair protein [Pasteurellales bacterium]
MMNKNCINQLQTKLSQLERERKQVLQHLALLDRKITSITESIGIMQQKQEIISSHNTPYFTYRTNKHKFKCKVTKTIMLILKQQPQRYFSTTELAKLLLEKGNQTDIVTDEHCKSVRGALHVLRNKGMVERYQAPNNTHKITWKLANFD